ncbi:hypothetical protein OJ963_31250 [Streptomyces sp. RS2]|uniref:hypothetical protein n=1 Tax=Streptomyces sp. RS2 TaxID=1451205 RepID=UPI0021F8EAF6|nr:hypothetical protein [Streptomyces sp. RS2]MCW1098322.1 hypothetical protein [Streptomyces sp. RS2]
MTDSYSHDSHEDAVHMVGELLEADFGDWELASVKEWAAARPGWECGGAGDGRVTLVSGRAGISLVLDAGKLGFESTRYTTGQVHLLTHAYRSRPGRAAGDRIAGLARALATVGNPVRYEDCGGAPGLRWRGERHTLIFQSNRRASWLALHPVPPRHADAADTAESLHDTGKPGERARVLSYEPGAALAQRRTAFGDLFDAVVGRIGGPTLFGGSAEGPNIRWRNERRLLILSGDRHGALLEVHDTGELEEEEHRDFKWGGSWSADEPSDFHSLPYLWQLDRGGSGWGPDVYPGGRLALGPDHLQDALGLILHSFVEHLPAQVGENWAGFVITHRGRDTVHIAFEPDSGLRLFRYDRAEHDSAEKTSAMHKIGWQQRERRRWAAVFPQDGEDSAARAARLIVTQLRSDGVNNPGEECALRDVTCNDMGTFDLYGTGIGR